MTEPASEDMARAVNALMPFVRRWGLSLNPEDVEEIAYAVLHHAHSTAEPEQIAAAVERQIDEHEENARRLSEAMQAQIDRRRPGHAERRG